MPTMGRREAVPPSFPWTIANFVVMLRVEGSVHVVVRFVLALTVDPFLTFRTISHLFCSAHVQAGWRLPPCPKASSSESGKMTGMTRRSTTTLVSGCGLSLPLMRGRGRERPPLRQPSEAAFRATVGERWDGRGGAISGGQEPYVRGGEHGRGRGGEVCRITRLCTRAAAYVAWGEGGWLACA